MATRTQKVKLGIFLCVTAALVVVTLVAFAGLDLFKSKNTYFVAWDSSVHGLEVGAPVKFRGVRVGTVTGFELSEEHPDQVGVALEVDRNAPVKTDSKAFLKLQGITGLKYVEIRGGSPEAPRLASGSRITAGEGTLDKVTDRAEELFEKADQLLESLVAVDWKRTAERFDRIILAAEHLVLTLDKDMSALAARADAVLVRADKVLGEAGGHMAHTSESVDALVLDARSAAYEARETVVELRGVVRSNDEQLRATIYNMREATDAFKELGRALQRRPSLLLFDKPPPERTLP